MSAGAQALVRNGPGCEGTHGDGSRRTHGHLVKADEGCQSLEEAPLPACGRCGVWEHPSAFDCNGQKTQL